MENKHIVCAIVFIIIFACIFTSNMGALAFVGNDVDTDLVGLVQGTSPLITPPDEEELAQMAEEGFLSLGKSGPGPKIENFINYNQGYWGYPFRHTHMKGVYPYRYQKESGITSDKHKYLPLYRPHRYWSYCRKKIPARLYK